VTDFSIATLGALIPFVLGLVYWAAHDPATIRMLVEWHKGQAQWLSDWARAQDARSRTYRKARSRHQKPALTPTKEPATV
jgi:hypothetical protein